MRKQRTGSWNPFGSVTRATTIDGFHNFHSGENLASFGNLCLTCKPYGDVDDTYYWWKYQPYYWQKQYQHCDKYGCGGSHDKSNCKQEFKPLNCSDMKYVQYDSRGFGEGTNDPLFYQNRAAFCAKYPNSIKCPNSFVSGTMCSSKTGLPTSTDLCPTGKEAWTTTNIS
jgi:hypothetical protein